MLNIYRPDWMDEAACAHVDPIIFFPGPGKKGVAYTKEAKQICRRCPVVNDCITYAMSFAPRSLTGIWGGMTERERTRQHKATTGLVYSAGNTRR